MKDAAPSDTPPGGGLVHPAAANKDTKDRKDPTDGTDGREGTDGPLKAGACEVEIRVLLLPRALPGVAANADGAPERFISHNLFID